MTKQPIELSFEANDFKLLEAGDYLFKLAAKKRTKELYDYLDTINENNYEHPEMIKSEILKISVKY